MRKNGFTLIELLVVVAIIGILSIIIVPSVINVNNNVNNRLLDSKKENITTAATLYASKNDDIFNGVDEVPVYVYELIDLGYVEIDVATGDSRCNTTEQNKGAKGCVLNPVVAGTLNNDYVILRKQGAGYTAEYVHLGADPEANTYVEKTLVDAVCDGFLKGDFVGKTVSNEVCYCYNSSGDKTGSNAVSIKTESGSTASSCIISGENPNNYLQYGDSKPNWRVLGVYKMPDNTLSAKIITSEPI